MNHPRDQLLAAFNAAVKAAMPGQAVREAAHEVIDTRYPKGRTIVVGGGKAAASMAKALEDAWEGPLEGVVVTRYGHAVERPRRIKLLEANHPIPDVMSEQAASQILESVRGLSKDDLVIVLISGGGSALMVAPNGVTLEEKFRINQQLLNSGAEIGEMNTVRKHLSGLKGGRLALAAAPARVIGGGWSNGHKRQRFSRDHAGNSVTWVRIKAFATSTLNHNIRGDFQARVQAQILHFQRFLETSSACSSARRLSQTRVHELTGGSLALEIWDAFLEKRRSALFHVFGGADHAEQIRFNL